MVHGTGLWTFGFSVFRGTGFRVRGFVFRCVGLGLSRFRVLEFRCFGYGVRGSGTGFRDSGLWVAVFVVRGCGGLGFRVRGSRFVVLDVRGFGYMVSGVTIRIFFIYIYLTHLVPEISDPDTSHHQNSINTINISLKVDHT